MNFKIYCLLIFLYFTVPDIFNTRQSYPIKQIHPIFVFVFFLGLLVAVVMALFLQRATAVEGLLYGAVIGLGLVIPTMLTHAL